MKNTKGTGMVKELKNGSVYWLGAAWGTFNAETGKFKMGNCFVHVSETRFSETPIQDVEDRFSGEPVDLGFDPDRAMGFLP